MVLPNAVLFPGILMPMYIFEPRYRRMLAEALQGPRMFAVGLADAQGGPHPVAGLGLIRNSVQRADGTSDVMVQGLERVRIAELTEDDPTRGYPVARVEVLDSRGETAAQARRPVMTWVRKWARARARSGQRVPKPLLRSLAELQDGGMLADVVGHLFIENPRQKQLVLQELDVRDRLTLVTALLQKQVEQAELWKTLQGDLPNEHVGFN